MFGWFRRLLRRSRGFSASERLIFRFKDGDTYRSIDPMPTYRALSGAWPVLEPDIQLLSSEFTAAGHFADAAEQALPNVASKVREIFKLDAYENGKGVTELEAMQLLFDFIQFTGGVKKNSKPKPIPTKETTASTVSPTEEPPTKPTSASG